MTTLPHGPLRQAIYDRLTAELSVPVEVQRRPKGDAAAPLVLIEPADATEWGSFKQLHGWSVPLTIRIHTRYPKGAANLSKREKIAEAVDTALRQNPLAPSGYALKDLRYPDVTMQTYDAGGEQAYDLLLEYPLDLQPTS